MLSSDGSLRSRVAAIKVLWQWLVADVEIAHHPQGQYIILNNVIVRLRQK